MSLAPGTCLGPYEVTGKLGEGGMGEVWRATDSRLRREVALKVLPAAFTEDRERLARFEREAQTLAALNHPNIASIYGVEESDGVRALVMELVEGEDLSVRMARGPMPLDEALPIARQIAEALEAAHERGIVHRDLKPQNVKVTAEGTVKVLDFGLAKAMETGAVPGSATDLARSPTLLAKSPTLTAAPGTQLGVILGTAAYMAPEQARGGAVDKRADVWAFGVILHEMLSGRRLFEGVTVSDTLAGVLRGEIDLEALPAGTPAELRRLLGRCLERNARNRLRDVGEARIALEAAMAGAGEAGPVSVTADRGRAWRRALPWVVAAGAVTAAIVLAISGRGRESPASAAPEPVHLELSLPPGVEPMAGLTDPFAIAPNGRIVATIGVRNGLRWLYVRWLDRHAATEIQSSSGLNSVTFSPDSASVAFVPGSAELVRLSLADQQRAVVARNVDLGTTIAWGESGIYFLRGGELWLAAAEGGGERRLTRLDRGRDEVIHTDVVELPGLRRSLFTSLTTNVDGRRIESVAHDGGARTVVVERASTPTLAPSGHLLFERDGAVWGAPFDARRAAVTGPAVLLLPAGEVHALPYGSLGFRLSTNGTLVYMPPDYDERRVVSVTREGVEQALELPPGVLANPRVSPDGRRLLVERGMSVVEALELTRGTRTQLAAAAFASAFSTWTADGERVVFRRFGVPAWVAADGSGRLGRMPHGGLTDFPSAPGPDADSVLTVRIQAQTAADIFLTSVSGAFAPRALLATPAYEGGPQLSPDSRWLAYQSNASGQPEVYVRPYPALDRAWQVSEAGGVQTRWSPDGREIYYRTGERMMAASFDGGGGEPLLGRPEPLFADEFDFGQGLSIANYDVTREGRFLMLRSTPSGGRLRVVLHWNEELERLLGTGGLR